MGEAVAHNTIRPAACSRTDCACNGYREKRVSDRMEPHAVPSDQKPLYHNKKRSLKGSMRENGFRAVGGLAQRLASGLAKGRGASIARLRAEWSAVVGPDLARVTRPEALTAGRGRSAKLLRLRVSGAAALEVQHKAGQVVERVNAYFGHKMIDDIRLVQGPIAATATAPPRPAPDARRVAEMTER